jgi:hypothetical protein
VQSLAHRAFLRCVVRGRRGPVIGSRYRPRQRRRWVDPYSRCLLRPGWAQTDARPPRAVRLGEIAAGEYHRRRSGDAERSRYRPLPCRGREVSSRHAPTSSWSRRGSGHAPTAHRLADRFRNGRGDGRGHARDGRGGRSSACGPRTPHRRDLSSVHDAV